MSDKHQTLFAIFGGMAIFAGAVLTPFISNSQLHLITSLVIAAVGTYTLNRFTKN